MVSTAGLAVRGGVVLFFVSAYALSLSLERQDLPGITPCLLRGLTGLSCPSCGLTRGFVDIAHGNVASALDLNVLSLPVYVLGWVLVPFLMVELLTRRDRVDRFLRRHRLSVYLVLLAAIAARYTALLLP